MLRVQTWIWVGRAKWWVVMAVFLVCGKVLQAAPKKLGELVAVDGKWRYLSSPHFEIYSHRGDRDARELLHNLEILRAVFFDQLKLTERYHVDVTVYAFASKKEFLAYAPQMFQNQDMLGGFHQFQSDRAVIVLPPSEDTDSDQQTIFHEYVHHLFRIAEDDPPLWFNEGTADIFAGMRVESDRVYIGTPFEGRVEYLRTQSLLPLDQLFAADQSSKIYIEEKHTGVFYSESWALVHFLHFGENGFSKGAVDKFLAVALDRQRIGKVDLAAHFKACFGCDYNEMGNRLIRYIMHGSYRAYGVPMPKLPSAGSYPARSVPTDEANLRLAELAVRVLHSGAGELILLNAADAKHPDPRSFETMGAESLLQGDDRVAAQRWESALAAGSKNPAIVRELALLEGNRWLHDYNENLVLPVEVTARLRERLNRSIQIEPEQGAAYEMLAWVEAFAERPDAKNINLVLSHLNALRDRRHTLVALAKVMICVGKLDIIPAIFANLDQYHLEAADDAAVAKLHDEFDAVRAATPHSPDSTASLEPEKKAETPTAAKGPGGATSPSAPTADAVDKNSTVELKRSEKDELLKTPSVAVPDDL